MVSFYIQIPLQFVGNKAKGQISKQVFQENKARQIFWKTNISYPFIHTRTCFNFLKHPFWDSAFCLITDEFVFAEICFPSEYLQI